MDCEGYVVIPYHQSRFEWLHSSPKEDFTRNHRLLTLTLNLTRRVNTVVLGNFGSVERFGCNLCVIQYAEPPLHL